MSPSLKLQPPRHPRYAIVRRLGQGGSSSVYLARDLLEDGAQVALKVARQDVARNELLREFRALRDLRHPGIPRAFDFARAAGGPCFLTLEHVAGPDLELWCSMLRRKKSVGWQDAIVQAFLQVTEALAYLHRKGLVHSDLKPANMVIADGRVVLIDFGLFCNAEHRGFERPRGTVYFSAPEVLLPRKEYRVDHRSDLYALGVSLYRGLTGRYPIVGRTVEEILENHQRARPEAPPGLPPRLAGIILKLLEKCPEHRFQSAEEVASELREASRGPGSVPELHAPLEAPFLARRGELEVFFEWFKGLSEARGPRVLSVVGGAGIGKTRFVEACVTEALTSGTTGVRVIPVRLSNVVGGSALRLLLEKAMLLRPLAAQDRRRWRFLLEVLGFRADSTSRREAEAMSFEAVKARVFQEARDVLEATASPCLLVVVEDLHRGDPQLAAFIRWFGAAGPPGVAKSTLGFLATSRPAAVRAAIQETPSEGVTVLKLGPLDRKTLRAILSEQDPPIGVQETRELLQTSGGSPGALARALCRRGMGHALNRLDVPGEEGAFKVASTLGDGARKLALALALLERPADGKLLAAATLLGKEALELARAELAGTGWSSLGRGGLALEEDAWGPVLRSAVSEELSAARERLGMALLSDPRHARNAARHLLDAGKFSEALSAVDRASRALKAAGRLDEAASLLKSALDRVGPQASGARRLEELGELEERCGQFDAAGLRYEQTLSVPGVLARDRLRLLRRLGGIRQRQGATEAARHLLDEAMGLCDSSDDVAEHLNVFRELSALHLFVGEVQRAQSFTNCGMELLHSSRARTLSRDQRARLAVDFHTAAGHIFLRQLDYKRAREELRLGLEHAERTGALSSAVLLLNHLGIAYHPANRLPEALRVYKRAEDLSRRLGDSTALLAIRCNVAAIRARLGEVRAAERLLLDAESLPHSRRSRRAHLFLLYTKGLVARLALEDSREAWLESIRIAEEVPDPLVASSARIFLLENEILEGRWCHAREILDALLRSKLDPRLERSAAARGAYLEALCGRCKEARALLGALPTDWRAIDHAGLWDRLYHGLTRLELGDLELAERIFHRTRKIFNGTKQAPGSFQCSIAMVEVALRRRDAANARTRIKEARAAIGIHEAGSGSRGAARLLPWLEARLDLLVGRPGGQAVRKRLRDAATQLSSALQGEVRWLFDLVASEHEVPGARRRLRFSRAAFVRGLKPEDRRSYLAREHQIRLGLGKDASGKAGPAEEARAASRRYETLLLLRRTVELSQALDWIMEGAEAAGGAIFLEEGMGRSVVRGRVVEFRQDLDVLRRACLGTGSGAVPHGWCAEVRGPGTRRWGVIFLLAGTDPLAADLPDFLEAAGVLVGEALARQRPDLAQPLPPTASPSEMSTQTRTLSPILLASKSPRMCEVVSLIERTRDSKLPVLLTGESGTGKDHLAHWIHSVSPCREGPFVAQDCSAIPAALLEAEIFGYEVGAFTGAERARVGCMAQAQGGTFYLDNVDSLTPEVQAKLVRMLETSAVRPLGSLVEIEMDVRLISSSQRDLGSLMAAGEFRKDLFYRLRGISIEVPPLRERAEDVPLLMDHFRGQMRGHAPDLAPRALELLKCHSWPGNVRELESVIRRLSLTAGATVDEKQVAHVLGLEKSRISFPRWAFTGRTYEQVLADVKREFLLHLFEVCGGDVARISKELGLTKRNVYLRYLQAGIRLQELRDAGSSVPG